MAKKNDDGGKTPSLRNLVSKHTVNGGVDVSGLKRELDERIKALARKDRERIGG